MASVSASHLIIFVASLVIAAGVVGTLTTGVERVSSSIDDGSLDVSQQIKTDISIISDPGATYTEGDDLTVHVRNTGSQSVPIEESAVDIVFNGQFLGPDDFTIEDANDADETVWRPGEVIKIETTGPTIDTDDNRFFITVNGDQELFEFRGE